MKKEDKELLFQDLCGRLPYGVKIDVIYSKDSGSSLRARLCFEGINILNTDILGIFLQSEIYIKPYLFPLSSMTEEQKRDYQYITERWMNDPTYTISDSFDWLHKNHFDYRGLIPMGLAIDCTNLNIY